MITVLVIVTFVLLVSLWLLTMYAWWSKEKGTPLTEFNLDYIETYTEKSERLMRRAWYRTLLYGRNMSVWGNKKMGSIFFTIFPDAAPAFAKRNALSGLTEGPSSYFLMSISEAKREAPKNTRRRRKIV